MEKGQGSPAINRGFTQILADKDSDISPQRRKSTPRNQLAVSSGQQFGLQITRQESVINQPHQLGFEIPNCLLLTAICLLVPLCASAVKFLKGFLSVSICVNLRLIGFDALRSAYSCLLPSACCSCFASSRESSFSRFRNPKFNRKYQISLPRFFLRNGRSLRGYGVLPIGSFPGETGRRTNGP